MKKVIVTTEVEGLHDNIIDCFEISDSATVEEIEREAKEVAFELISWSYYTEEPKNEN